MALLCEKFNALFEDVSDATRSQGLDTVRLFALKILNYMPISLEQFKPRHFKEPKTSAS